MASPPFKFIVGEEKRVFYVHGALASHHSKPLGCLINGPMLEASEKCAILDDVDPNIFDLVSQWFYTGDYPTPKVSKPLSYDSGEKVPRACEPFRKKLTSFRNCYTQVPDGPITVANPYRGRIEPILDHTQDYTDVFLYHAQVYTIADRYNLVGLEALCIRKLQHTVANFTMFVNRIKDVLELIRYATALFLIDEITLFNVISCAYDDENTFNNDKHPTDRLRSMLVHFIEVYLDDLMKVLEFQAFLMEGGEFVRDLMMLQTETSSYLGNDHLNRRCLHQ